MDDVGIKDDQISSLEYRASPMSMLFFSWLDTLIWKGFRRPLTQDQLPPPPDTVNVHSNVERYVMFSYHINNTDMELFNQQSIRIIQRLFLYF